MQTQNIYENKDKQFNPKSITPVTQRFKLDQKTIDEIQSMKPKFGFNGLGEVVFRRTYSRDNESWNDVVIRVIEGVMSIRKDHFHKQSLYWSDSDWQPFAREMAISMFNMEWLPPGRGLWMMGTDFAYKRGSMALNNCFSVDTQFWTTEGLKSFGDYKDGDKVTVRGKNKWMPATIRSFGVQKLWELKVQCKGKTNTIFTTADHRWIVKCKKGGNNYNFKIKTTKELENGWKLQKYAKRTNFNHLSVCPVGIQHGIVFGDGSYNKTANTCQIQLCGNKQNLSKYFFTERANNKCISGLPNNWKNLPTLSMNKDYLLGFMSGIFATDGSIDKSSNMSITNSNKDIIEWYRAALFKLDILTGSVKICREKCPYSGEHRPSYRIYIQRNNVPEKFFIRDDQRERFSYAKENLYWRVSSVTETKRTEEVWCVVEPEYEEFTLEGGIVTKNCAATETLHDLVHSAEWTMDALMNGVGCIPSDTDLLTENGIKPIKDIKIGDKVWSFNTKTNSKELKTVVKLHNPIVTRNENIKFICKYGSITTSKTHPIMVYDNINGYWTYKLGKDIRKGDILHKYSLKKIEKDTVINIQDQLDIDENWKDITVKDNNNYFTGEKSLYCLHNCGFDTSWRGIVSRPNKEDTELFVINDSREGWVHSLIKIMCAYINSPKYGKNKFPKFDYSLIREAGKPIKGFGGLASGPAPLQKLHKRVESYLDSFCDGYIEVNSVKKPYNHTRLIADIFNAIGACVVAGNVRRCLSEGSRVHTNRGLVPIEEVKVGDSVCTMKGYKKVLNTFDQGQQKLVKINTNTGYFRCTPNHRMAVHTKYFDYEWKCASELKSGDRLITSHLIIDGEETQLPLDENYKNLTIPKLDKELAWFIGVWRRDLPMGSKINIYTNNSVCKQKIISQLKRFGVIVEETKRNPIYVVHTDSIELASYYNKYIKWRIGNKIPDFILKGTKEIREGYLQGVTEGDYVINFFKESIAHDLQCLAYSCGQMTVLTKIKERQYNIKFIKSSKDNYNFSEVVEVVDDKTENTYDIEVEDEHEFFCNGYLTHNSAEIALGDVEDRTFINLKNYGENPERGEIGWMSNNSVVLQPYDDYEDFSYIPEMAKRIHDNGEPGMINLYNMQKFGRYGKEMKDKANLVNPCVTDDTWVTTKNGAVQVKDLIGKKFEAMVDGKLYECDKGFFSTGKKPVFKLVTKEGFELRATANHKIMTADNKWIELKDLIEGDKIRVHKHSGVSMVENNKEFSKGWLIGSLYGDGTVYNSRRYATLNYSGKTGSKMMEIAMEYLGLYKMDYIQYNEYDQIQLISKDLFTLAQQYISQERNLTIEVEKQDQAFIQGFLRGWFDADGSIQEDKKKGVSINLVCDNSHSLKKAQRMALRLGIYSEIRQTERPGIEKLIVPKSSIKTYYDMIGFHSPLMSQKLKEILSSYKRPFYGTRYEATITSIEPDGVHEVYDATVKGVHAFDANGIYVHNCGEIALENMELCVSGDTRILTRQGYPKICDCVGKQVEIWNGSKWSTVTPFKTASDQTLYRVTMTDGSHLDVTAQHKWSVKNKTASKYRKTQTQELKIGMRVESTEVNIKNFKETGKPLENAYLWGFYTGDGYIGHVSSKSYMYVVLHGNKKKLYGKYIYGIKYKEQHPNDYKDSFFRVNVTKTLKNEHKIGQQLRDSSMGLPDIFFTMDTNSICEFIAGWIDSDGTIRKQKHTTNYVIDSTAYNKLLDLQLLLRRIGINYSSVNIVAKSGQKLVINNHDCIRKKDLYRIYIPSFECPLLAKYCKLKITKIFGQRLRSNPSYPNSIIDQARKQYIRSIEILDGKHDTFCFTEPIAHKGVFNNVLTHQCNLSESFPPRCKDKEIFFKALKYATFYASTVSLLPTHRPETNAVIAKNRRIGVSISGVAQWASGCVPKGWGPMNYTKMTTFLRKGYKIVREENKKLADAAGVPASIRVTTIKPSGSISLLAGVTPGIHYPVSRYAIRRMRIGKDSPLVQPLIDAGIKHEDDTYSDNTMVFEFVIDHGDVRPCKDVSPWEQFNLMAMVQRTYSDNCVSCTIYFDKEKETPENIEEMLAMFIPVLKSVSMLPHAGHGYAQAPYEPIDKETYMRRRNEYKLPDFNQVKGNVPEGSRYCNGDKCVRLPLKKKRKREV